jgi:hypothetical protein
VVFHGIKIQWYSFQYIEWYSFINHTYYTVHCSRPVPHYQQKICTLKYSFLFVGKPEGKRLLGRPRHGRVLEWFLKNMGGHG